MSIVRIGLAETKHFAEGYEAIFGKRSAGAAKGKKGGAAAKKPKAVAKGKAKKKGK